MKKLLVIFKKCGLFIYFLLSTKVYAAFNLTDYIDNLPTFEDLGSLAISILSYVAVAIAAGVIMFSGYTFMTSQGNPDKVKEASENLTSAIIGLIFIALAYVILRFLPTLM